jgi:cytochrome c
MIPKWMNRIRNGLILASALIPGSMVLSMTPADNGDPVIGKRQFATCGACHTVEVNGPNKIGPNLHGIFGRKAGSKTDFTYSNPMKNAGFTWDPEKLYNYIANPQEVVPGNNMAFIGITKDNVRANIIAYLKEATS